MFFLLDETFEYCFYEQTSHFVSSFVQTTYHTIMAAVHTKRLLNY